ncbi:SDR family oxidoreductase [Arthrobacter sp. CC3]|uniref:SDR family oxidoreductase n=1 Tax=Arthrobacter sp. CC3 TaxID=3029185 RepID=UPI003266CBBB
MASVKDKVVIVTGASQGMGESHVRMLAAAGAKVIAGDLNDVRGKEIAAELGDSVRYVHLDVVNPGDWRHAASVALEAFGAIDVLVNNAAISGFSSIENATVEEFRRTMDINVLGVFNGIQAVATAMVAAKRGSIINISSISGMKGSNHLHAYTASKWAVRGLTKSVALDLGKYGIRVNSIHPGQILTPAAEALGIEFPTGHVALGRAGLPEEISELVLYLASDSSRFSTGSEFVADGGEMAGLPQTLV